MKNTSDKGISTKEMFINLVKKYGEDNELETFDYCSNYGLALADSTIDKIKIDGGYEVLFYYNENTGDFDYVEDFDDSDLLEFYNALIDAIAEENPSIEVVEKWWKHNGCFDREQISGIPYEEQLNYLFVTDNWWERLTDDQKKDKYKEFFDEN